MKIKIISLVTVVMFLFSCKQNAPDNSRIDVKNKIQTVLESDKENITSGGVVAIINFKNGVNEIGYFGNSDDSTLINPSMSQGIGSNTKLFTVALIFKLIEENKLSLTDDLNKLLPEWVNDRFNGVITVQQLLTHSSGINDPLNAEESIVYDAIENPSKKWSTADYFNAVKAPEFQPGENHSYSNPGYTLLGLIIEKITDKPYHEYLREQIIEPLKLKNTFLMGYEKPNNETANCYLDGESLKDLDRTAMESLAWSSGSIFSTVEDLAIFYRSFFNGKVVSDTSLEIITTTYPADDRDYGSGIFSNTIDGNKFYYHTGQTIAYNSMMLYDKKSEAIIFVFINTIEDDPTSIAFDILERYEENL